MNLFHVIFPQHVVKALTWLWRWTLPALRSHCLACFGKSTTQRTGWVTAPAEGDTTVCASLQTCSILLFNINIMSHLEWKHGSSCDGIQTHIDSCVCQPLLTTRQWSPTWWCWWWFPLSYSVGWGLARLYWCDWWWWKRRRRRGCCCLVQKQA